MRHILSAIFIVTTLVGCSKDSDKGGSKAPAEIATATSTEETTDTSTPTAPVGTLALGFGAVQGVVQPKDGAPAESVAGANLTVAGHPEITGVTDENGKFNIQNVVPGTIALFIVSEGTALTSSYGLTTTSYGLKLPDVIVKANQATDTGTNKLQENGSLSGTVTFFQNPNDLEVTGTDIYIPGTSWAAKADDNGHFFLTGIPPGTYTVRVERDGLGPVRFDKVLVNEGQDTALGEVSMSISSGPEGSISIDPDLTVSIGGSAKKVATTRHVDFNVMYSAGAALMKISDDPLFFNASWQPVAKTSSWNFTTDGAKTLYIAFSDLNGLASSPASDQVIVDTEAPELAAFSLLNGWAQTAQRTIFADIDATDTGTGVADVILSESSTFAGAQYSTFAARKDVLLATGNVNHTVYARVRDYAGHESVLPIEGPMKDDIVLDTTGRTLIEEGELDEHVTLFAAQSPYLFSGNTTFNKSLTVEPGVDVLIESAKVVTVKGEFKAAGSAAHRIAFNSTISVPTSCTDSSFVTLSLEQGRPGGSANNKIQYADFDMITLKVNGGLIDSSTFTAHCNNTFDYGMNIVKSGLDKLTVTNNTFTDWGRAIDVASGNGLTTFTGNQGDVRRALWQHGTATNTYYADNQMNLIGTDSSSGNGGSNEYTAISISNGHVKGGPGNTFTTPNTGGILAFLAYNTSGTTSIQDFEVTGVESGVAVAPGGTFNISNSKFTGLNRFMAKGYGGGSSAINVTQSDIEVATALAYRSYGVSDTVGASLSIDYSNITCSNASGPCDLLYVRQGSYALTATLSLDHNNITCSGNSANGCRGIMVRSQDEQITPVIGATTLVLTLDNNYWSGKDPTGINSAQLRSTCCSETPALDGTLIRVFDVQIGSGLSSISGLPVSITSIALVTGAGSNL